MIKENISLKPFHSFGIDVRAKYFATFKSIEELQSLLSENPDPKQPLLVLGGGSNVLFTKDFDGLLLKNEFRGIEMIRDDDDAVYIRAGAGENWHGFVIHCIENGWAGVENLSLIPGCTGASPMQNIGAYGVEISSVFHDLRAFHLKERSNYTFTAKDCEFGYRDSIFKNRYRNQFVITDITYRLLKKPVFNTAYGTIEKELDAMGVKELSIKAISDAVIRIRRAKLPDPAVIGNAGSFFKNPSVTGEEFLRLKSAFPGIIGHVNADGTVKLAAGWLIEHCGPGKDLSWKGFRLGDAGCHDRQALVLVNYGNATGQEIYELSRLIQESVKEKFNIEMEREVNVI